MVSALCFNGGERYLRAIVDKYPVLSREEEVTLYEKYLDGSIEAMQELIMHNIRYVLSVVQKYKPYGFEEYELMQEGIIGLMKGLKNYDPKSGFRVITFCDKQINYQIKMYIMKNSDVVSLTDTKYNKRLFYGFSRAINEYERTNDCDCVVHDQWSLYPSQKALDFVSNKLGVEKQHVMDFVPVKYGSKSLDAPTTYDDGGVSLHDYLSTEETLFDCVTKHEQIDYESLTSCLSEKEKNVIYWRYIAEDQKSLKQLAEESGVSHQAIHDTEKRALKKLKTTLGEM